MYYRCLAILLILSVTLSLGGCGSTGSNWVPVVNSGERARGNYYRVQRGDTLYSIAWRYGLDYKQLARINDISPPYTIYVNQRIRLHDATGKQTRKRRQVKKDGPPPGPPRSPPPKTDIATAVSGTGAVDWRWPLEGEIIEAFSLEGKVNKGVDIRGKAGDPVRSAAGGVVVYAGGGLRGYGKLVIVKHNDQYLSAYAHNRAVLVKEGDKVSAGQVVARIGASGPDTEMLHFEIRRDGKPEDPLRYLPPR